MDIKPVKPSVVRPVQKEQKSGGKQSKSKFGLATVIATVSLAIALLAVVYVVYKDQGGGLAGVDKGKYQAVFLTNGQVYFGKVNKSNSGTVEMLDIYYLQVGQDIQLQQPDTEKSPAEDKTQLIKLGEEIHGPEDKMFIDRRQVMFWENLRDDSKVVKAIKEFNNK